MGPHMGGVELSLGEELGRGDVPICHGEPMAKRASTYLCGRCPAVVELDEHGLIFDIRR